MLPQGVGKSPEELLAEQSFRVAEGDFFSSGSETQFKAKRMTCKHLKDLYAMCERHQLRLSSGELIRIVCSQCGVEEVCPSVLSEEYEKRHQESDQAVLGSGPLTLDDKLRQ